MCTGLTRPRCASCTTWGEELGELPVAVVAAARPAEPTGGSPLLAALAADPSAEVLVLAPLSVHAVAELVRLGLGTERGAGFRGRLPPGDRRRSVPRPRTRPRDCRSGHRADGGDRVPRRGARAARGLTLGRAPAEPAVRRRPRAGTGGGRAGRGRPPARSRPRRGGPRPRRHRSRRARRRRDPRGRPATAVRPPHRPGGGRGRSAARRAGWPARGGGAAPRGRGRVCAPRRSPPAGSRPGRRRLGRRFTRVGRPGRDRQWRTGLDRRLSAAGAGRTALGAAPPRRPARAGLRRVLCGRPAGGGSS